MDGNLEECTREELIAYIEKLKRQNRKRFGLVWEEKIKPEKVVEECETKLPVVKDVEEKAIENAPGEPTNVIIEGDNYHALSVLNYTHAGKIDVIYIDPPYNTGNKDFVYNDCYVDKEDSFRHSKWLSFMDKRLRLAKNLLADDGVIFISIDDNEQADLKLLCDGIFGAEHFIATIPRLTSAQRSGQEKYMNVSHDYVLCYAYSDNFDFIIDREITKEVKQDKNGKYIEGDTKAILAALSQGYSKGGDYDFEYHGKIYSPILSDGTRNRWLWSRERMEAAAKLGILVETKSSLRMQIYIDKKFDEKTNTLTPKNPRLIFHTADFIKAEYANTVGAFELEKVAGKNQFPFPKPTTLIKKLVLFCSKKDSIILDFFAGSGTTGQAVMELNKEDGGHRQFILVTNNENQIAEEVTYPRVKTVITGTRSDGSKYSDGIPANLRYFKTDFVEKGKTTDDTREALITECCDMIRIRENAFEYVASTPEYRFYKNDKVFVPMIFDQFAIAETWEKVEELNTENLPVHCYNFSYNRHANEEEIPEDTKLEWTACSIPETVLEVYKKIFRRKES